MQRFLRALELQRWDDHRYYHHSTVNQFLHFLSAIGFLCAYVMVFFSPAVAALVAWLFSMGTRQSGHFFFEPTGFDEKNQVTHEYKEEIKVGYNLRRKVVLIAIWALVPVLQLVDPSVFGLVSPHTDAMSFIENMGVLWLGVGVGGLLFRTVHLFFIKDVQTGLVWFTKILTDPFNDIRLYHRAPLYLMRGQMLDPGTERHAA